MQMIEHHRRAGVELPKERLPIAAITRAPIFFAFRYTLPSHKIRRMQCRFTSEVDFRTVVRHMEKLGLSMTEHVVPGSSALPVNRHQPRASSPLAKFSEVPTRPQTAVITATSMAAPPRPSTAIGPCTSVYRSTTVPSGNFIQANDPTPPSTASSHSPSSESPGNLPDMLLPPERWQRPAPMSSLPYIPEHAVASSMRSFSPSMEDNPISSTLPPRRELLFNRPLSSASNDDAKSLQRTSGDFTASRLTVPRMPTIDQTPTQSFSLAQRLDLPVLPKPTLLEHSAARAQAASSSIPINSSRTNSVAGTKPFDSTHSGTLNRDVSLSSSEVLQNVSEDRLVPQLLDAGPGSKAENLIAYAALSARERTAILDDFFANIVSNDFLVLVEDVETNWARVALGLE
ncbi:hypothetical protein P154DRAFT_283085 [Amniculicola lignicola CBS 123094]|uniref:Uncharacterized protein n=1 Tax=Amniculicola lignicola CBS 123094 TaxID=1392246 RepID=A0A6A5WI78_9PLEO|nr:hypothetical protein P154DRAFT_283085 [Amniculicola lignicola CBS 123094]